MRDILIKLLMWLITTLSNIFIVPVVTFLTSLMPDLSVAISTVNSFVTGSILPYMKFAKAVFMNCTGFWLTMEIDRQYRWLKLSKSV